MNIKTFVTLLVCESLRLLLLNRHDYSVLQLLYNMGEVSNNWTQIGSRKNNKNGKYTAKVGQDNVNIGVVTTPMFTLS